jgi:hypothetical protein
MWAALGGIAGAIIGSKSAGKASDAQVRAAQLGIDSQEKMFNQSLALQAPYRNAGYGAVKGLQGLVDPAQRAQTLQGYYDSDEYAMMENQAQQSTLRSASATGNMRGGAGAAAIGAIAPQLGMQFLNNQQNQYTGLANMGMGAASQGANAANNLGLGMANSYNQIGDAQAQGILAKGNIWGNTLGKLGGFI